MDRKVIMGVAAVAGIGLLLYMRKRGDSAAIGSAAAGLNSAGGFSNWAANALPVYIGANKPDAVRDGAVVSPPPAPAPAPASPASAATWGGTTGQGPDVGSDPNNGGQYGRPGPNGAWIWPDGTTSGGGVTGAQALSVMGY